MHELTRRALTEVRPEDRSGLIAAYWRQLRELFAQGVLDEPLADIRARSEIMGRITLLQELAQVDSQNSKNDQRETMPLLPLPDERAVIEIVKHQATVDPAAQWSSELVLKLIGRIETQRECMTLAGDALEQLATGMKQAHEATEQLTTGLRKSAAA